MKTYTIYELSKEAKEKALESIMNDNIFRNKDVDLDWKVEGTEEELEDKFGLFNVEVSFTGFWSQGDGASFTGRVGDLPRFIRAIGIEDEIPDKIMNGLDETYHMTIVRIHNRYFHENTVSFDIEEMGDPELVIASPFGAGDVVVDLNKFLDEIGFEAKASKWLKEKCRSIYDELEKAYEE